MLTRFCERCERQTVDGHLWCPERDCPAEAGYPVFKYGDFLGDLKITKLVTVYRHAAIYAAERNEEPVWVKVAHTAPDCDERLKREAQALEPVARAANRTPKWLRGFMRTPRHSLPILLPPYPAPSKRPYGEITFRGETKVFMVFEPFEGVILADLLKENPQLWHYEVAWIVTHVAETLRPWVSKGLLHLSLTPDVILVDRDKQAHWRTTLLDLGWLVSPNDAQALGQALDRCEPAYTAPEVLVARTGVQVTQASDVHSLGLVTYEMLAGRPGFEPKLLRDERVRRAVTQNRAVLPVERPELEGAGVVKIVERATALTDRFPNILEFARALLAIYGPQPKEVRPLPIRTYLVLALVVVLLLIVLGIAAYLLYQVAVLNPNIVPPAPTQ